LTEPNRFVELVKGASVVLEYDSCLAAQKVGHCLVRRELHRLVVVVNRGLPIASRRKRLAAASVKLMVSIAQSAKPPLPLGMCLNHDTFDTVPRATDPHSWVFVTWPDGLAAAPVG
jgi:hypothetical protein